MPRFLFSGLVQRRQVVAAWLKSGGKVLEKPALRKYVLDYLSKHGEIEACNMDAMRLMFGLDKNDCSMTTFKNAIGGLARQKKVQVRRIRDERTAELVCIKIRLVARVK